MFAVAPVIELTGTDTFTPDSSIILSSVIGPFPFALKWYKYETVSPVTAWLGCMYAYAAGVAVDVMVTVGVFVGVAVNVPVFVTVNVAVFVTVNVAVAVTVNVAVCVIVNVGVFVIVNVAVSVTVKVGVAVGVTVSVTVCVTLGVMLGVAVSVMVKVSVAVCVTVSVTVMVTLGVMLGVAVSVTVKVGVTVGVTVCVAVRVAVSVGGDINTTCENPVGGGAVFIPFSVHGYVFEAPAVVIALNVIMSKFGSFDVFQPGEYVTTMSPEPVLTLAPGIRLTGSPTNVTFKGMPMSTSVTGPLPLAFTW